MKIYLTNHWQRIGILSIFLALFALTLMFPQSKPALALSTTTVTTTAIKNDPSDGQCDLWEALQAIAEYNNGSNTDGDGDLTRYHECNTGSGPHFVTFTGAAAGGVIKLPTMMNGNVFSTLPFITDDVTITGPVVIDGGGAAVNAHIFWVNAGGKLTLVNLVVQNGYTSGAGGAIISQGPSDVINILGCSFQNNVAEGVGGAIYAAGEVNVMFSNFSGNRALGLDGPWGDAFGQGGAIYQTGYNDLNISLSNFAGNIASDGGGAIYTLADTGTISDSVFNGNIVNDDVPTEYTQGGGAIYNGGNNSSYGLTITRVAFNGNLSFNAHGGAIYNGSDGYLHINDSSFNGNIAGTLVYNRSGGAIYNLEELDVRRVMFLGNVASSGPSLNDDQYGNGGAIANDKTGVARFANVSFTANGAPGGLGGAIWNGTTQQGGPASYTYLYNTTFSLNTSLNNDGAAIYNQSDGSHAVYLANTIVDGLGIGGNNCNEALNSQGHNIDSGNTCGFNQTGDKPDTDPGIKTLDFNGGPLVSLLSHGLNPDSEAIDAGSNGVCSNEYVNNLDQRSDPRPKGNACDIGAFESDAQVSGYGSLPIPPGPVVIGNTSMGTPITNTIWVLNVGNIDLELSTPQITGSNPEQFEVVTFPSPISYQDEIVLGCKATAEGNFTALFGFQTSAPDIPGVVYELQCQVNPAPTPGFESNPIAPGTLNFGQVEVGNGDTSVKNLVFSETGNATLNIGNFALSGPHPSDFTFNTLDIIIPDQAAPIALPITCTPSDFGVRTATLTITTTDPTQTTVSYTLVCEGIAPPSPPLAPPDVSLESLNSPNIPNGANGLAVSPDGLFIYVTSYINDTLTVYRRDKETSQLSFVMDYTNIDMGGAAMVKVSPDGTQVYVTAQDDNTFLIFSRDPGTGMIFLQNVHKDTTVGGGVSGMQYPYGISVSPDGRFIYVSSWISNAIVTFYRDSDGYVGWDNTLMDGTYLYNAYKSVLSPDGKFLYVSGGINAGAMNEGWVTVYQRDILDGSLTFVQQIKEGDLVGCYIICLYVSGLGGAWGITISPDGRNIYVAGYFDSAIVRFTRDPFDGTIAYGGSIVNTLAQTESPEDPDAVQVPGILGVTDVRVSPDGKYLYATGYASDALAVFSRHLANGILTQVQVLYDGGALTLNGAKQIDVTPDGNGVYATAYESDAVQALQIANPIPTLSSLLPASAQAGSGSLTVKLQGDNFVPSSIAQVNGSDRPTSFIHPGELEITFSSGDLSSAGALTIHVLNPTPGGGTSVNSLAFTVTGSGQNPVPAIASLTPGGAVAGSAALTVDIYGFNFINGSTVKWNGTTRAKTFISSTHLQITVTATDLLTPGPVVLTIENPGPGGGTSNAVTFDVAGPGQNPVPSISAIAPWFVNARGAGSLPIVVTVTGQNFIPGVQAQWNGQNRPTQYVSETEIRITLFGYDLAFGGSGAITVINPAPGGGASSPYTFIIYGHTLQLPLISK